MSEICFPHKMYSSKTVLSSTPLSNTSWSVNTFINANTLKVLIVYGVLSKGVDNGVRLTLVFVCLFLYSLGLTCGRYWRRHWKITEIFWYNKLTFRRHYKNNPTTHTLTKWLWNLLQWRHNERHGVSNPRCLDCLLNRFFRHTSQKTWKLRVTGYLWGKPSVTCGFPSQRAGNTETVYIWWRHHAQAAINSTGFLEWNIRVGEKLYQILLPSMANQYCYL